MGDFRKLAREPGRRRNFRALAKDLTVRLPRESHRSDAAELNVRRLRGDVHCWAERADAELAAWAAEGVWQVDDELRVQG